MLGYSGCRKGWPRVEMAQAGWDLPARHRWTMGGREGGFLRTQLPHICPAVDVGAGMELGDSQVELTFRRPGADCPRLCPVSLCPP